MRKIFTFTIIVLVFIMTSAISALAATSGSCGTNATWTLEGGVLTISGTGAIQDYGLFGNSEWNKQMSVDELYDFIQSIGSGDSTSADKTDTAITDLVINEGITSIGEHAFFQLKHLKNVVIPDSVTEIKDYSFSYCESLSSIDLPANLDTVDCHLAFSGSDNLEMINISTNNKKYSSQDGVVFNKDRTALLYCPSGKTGTLVIPEGVSTVDASALHDSEKIDTIHIPSTLYRFTVYPSANNVPKLIASTLDLKNLKAIDVDAGNGAFKSDNGCLLSADGTVFYRCPRGKTGDYVIPDGVKTIANGALGWNSLNSVSIPASVTSIEALNFDVYYNPAVYFRGSVEQWNSISVDNYNDNLVHAIVDGKPLESADEIKVYVHDKWLEMDQPPVIEDGRTLVPLRAIFEAIQASVDWDAQTQTVTSVKDDITVSLTIGEKVLYKNGEAIELDVPAKIINERTLVPVRAVAESFNLIVKWDDDTRSVIITYY